MSVVYDQQLIELRAMFEKKTGAQVKECFYDKNEKLTFVIEAGDMGKALGKGKAHLFSLQEALGKKIRVVEFSPDRITFIKNMIAPLQIKDVDDQGEIIILHGVDLKTNGLLIGKQARNLRNLEWMVNKFHEVKEIKVV
jgi:transcription termination/antitermination protein NusA